VKELLSHERITTTERYAHLADTALKKAARETEVVADLPALAAGAEASQLVANWARLDRAHLTNEPFLQGAPDTSRTRDQRFRKPLDNGVMSRGYEAEGQLATVSRELLLAVAADDADAACARAMALARGVLESPVVALASAVLRGGPLAMTKALALAERLLATSGTSVPERSRRRTPDRGA
jgi:hypothetical protein